MHGLKVIAIIMFVCGTQVQASNECRPSLIIGGKNSPLIKHDLTTGHQDYELFSSHMTFGQVNSFAFDKYEGLLFFVDSDEYKIYKKNIGTDEQPEIIINLASDATLEKLAIDTNLKIIFYTDSGQGKIVRMDYLGNNMTTILDRSNDLQLAAGITLDSATRTLFYSNWNLLFQAGYIAKNDYDGDIIQILQNSNINSPLGLSIWDNRLYWCDSLQERVTSINFDGSERKEEIYRPGYLSSDISVHDDLMYITETALFQGSSVQRFNLSDPSNTLMEVVSSTNGFRINCAIYICLNDTSVISDSTTNSNPISLTSRSTQPTSSTHDNIPNSPADSVETQSTTQSLGVDVTFESTVVDDLSSTAFTTTQDDEADGNNEGNQNNSDNTLIVSISIATAGLVAVALIISISACILKRNKSDQRPDVNAIPSDYLTGPGESRRNVYESISDSSERNSQVPSIVEQPLQSRSNDNIRVGINVLDSDTIPSVYLTGRNLNELNLYDSIPEGMEGDSVPRELPVLINDGLPNVNTISSVYLTQQNENECNPNEIIPGENESHSNREESTLPHYQNIVAHNLESGAMARDIDDIQSVYLTKPCASNSQATYLVPVDSALSKTLDTDFDENDPPTSNSFLNSVDMVIPNDVKFEHSSIPSVYLTQMSATVSDPIYYG